MDSITIECLHCGQWRPLSKDARRRHEAGECPRCSYVGWAYSSELNETSRRLLRDVPLERRLFLRPVA